MKKVFYSFLLFFSITSTHVLLSEGSDDAVHQEQDLVDAVKKLKGQSWWESMTEKYTFTEEMAYILSGLAGVASGGTAWWLGGSSSILLMPILTYLLSIKTLYRFTLSGKYRACIEKFEKIARAFDKKPLKKSDVSLDDAVLFAQQYFNKRTPIFSAVKFLADMNSKLAELAKNMKKIANQTDKNEIQARCAALLKIIKPLQTSINAYIVLLMGHEDFEDQKNVYYEQRDKKRQADKQDRMRREDRDAALQNGNIGYQHVVK